MGGACSTHGGNEHYVQNFGRKASRDETTWKRKGRLEGRPQLKLILSRVGGCEWLHMAQNNDRWRT
jgi:hypothetical protein